MHARSRQLARRYPLGPLQHAEDPADGPTRLLALGPQHQVHYLGGHRATRAAVCARLRRQTRQPLGSVRVVPGLDSARRDARHPPARRHVVVPRRRLEVRSPVAVLQPSADQRPEHTEAKEPDGPPRLVVHAATLLAARHHKGWDPFPRAAPSQGLAAVPHGHMRRIPRSSRCNTAANGESRSPRTPRPTAWNASTSSPRVPSRPTAIPTSTSSAPPLIVNTAQSTRADDARRARHRRWVVGDTDGALDGPASASTTR